MPAPDIHQKKKPDKAPPGGGLNSLVQAERLLQIAFILPCAVVVGWLAGVLFDRWLHLHWLSIAGLILGGIAGLVETVRQALHAGGKQS